MPKGPQLNKLKKNFTTRDSLGIEGVATSIAAEICPVVTTVTPRAFYWPFLVWIYYDFYKYSGIKEHTGDAFNRYVKKQDYFFVMAALISNNPDKANIVGVTQCTIDSSKPGPYKYNKDYFSSRFGGMQYYNGGCDAMDFIKDRNPDTGEAYPFTRLTREGEKIALSFENVIKNTEYYKRYRLYDIPVPRDVLEEYGKTINIGLVGFNESKSILRHRLFEVNPQLSLCAKYIRFLYDNYHITSLTLENARRILFDHFTQGMEAIVLPHDLKKVADQWEIFIARQYFTSGLEMIWKSMLMKIESDEPADKKAWIERMISRSSFSWDIGMPLEEVIKECVYDFNNRERMIKDATRGKTLEWNLENGIKILLSVYNWLQSKNDLGDETKLFDYGIATHSISFNEFRNVVSEYKDHKIVDFMAFVMEQWLCDQHYYTAFNKLMQGRDGFYYELVDNQYSRKHDFDMAFQGNRMVQLMQIMKDLDMLG